MEDEEAGDLAPVGQRARAALHGNTRFVQPRRQRVERRRVRHLPAEEAEPVRAVFHQQALRPVVHAEGARLAAAIHPLHAQEARGEAVPLVRPR